MKNGIKLNTLRMRVGEDGETDRDRVLWWLVEGQHGDIAREYVRINTDVRDVVGKDYYGKTTLALASQHGYVEVVDALIATGADVNKASNEWLHFHTLGLRVWPPQGSAGTHSSGG
jgi:ankyrin repeat protein